jgi:MFS family permease
LKNKQQPIGFRSNPSDGSSIADNKLPIFLGKIKTFESFQSRGFSFFFLSMVGHWSAFNMQTITNSLLAYRITGSGTILGVVALGNALPTLLLCPFGGVVADRMSKKILLQISQAAAVLVTVIIGLTLLTGYMSPAHPDSWWVLLITSIFSGIVFAFTVPARQSLIPELVDRAHLMNAISLNTMGMNLFRLVSPAIAGFLIDAVSFEFAYFIMAGLFFMGMVFTAFIPNTPLASVRYNHPLDDIKQGLQYVRVNDIILFILSFDFVVVLFFMPFQNLLPIFTEDILKVGATGLGIFMSVFGAGALLASILLASLFIPRQGLVHLISTMVLSLTLLAFAFSANWLLSLVLIFIIGMSQTGHLTTGMTLTQSLTESQYMGRVMSLLLMTWGLSGLGTFFAGILSDHISPQWTIGIFAMILTLISIAALIFAPKIRRLK